MKKCYSSLLRIALVLQVLLFYQGNLSSYGQDIDILLKGGHVIDPAGNIDAAMDVAVVKDKIFRVAPDIPADNAAKVIDVKGMYVTPGLIDIHTHVFVGSNQGFADGFSSVSPDDFTFKAGITSVVDAGTSGWRNFPVLRSRLLTVHRHGSSHFLILPVPG